MKQQVNKDLKGRRIELIQTNDPYTNLKPGDQGTIDLVDDTGTLFVNWDNGSKLGLVPGKDQYKILFMNEHQMDDCKWQFRLNYNSQDLYVLKLSECELYLYWQNNPTVERPHAAALRIGDNSTALIDIPITREVYSIADAQYHVTLRASTFLSNLGVDLLRAFQKLPSNK